jgi:hypothetical protein
MQAKVTCRLLLVFCAVFLWSGSHGLLDSADCKGPGQERWPVKISVPTGANLTNPKAVSLKDVLDLGDVPGVKHDDARFQSARIPDAIMPINLHEGDIIAITGFIHLIATEDNDCDYHVQVSLSQTDGDHCIIVEVPRPDFASNAELHDRFQKVRDFMKALVKGQEPSSTGNVMTHPPFVQIVGQFFYDDAHVGDPPRGKKKMHAANLWEVHPIVGIAFSPLPH